MRTGLSGGCVGHVVGSSGRGRPQGRGGRHRVVRGAVARPAVQDRWAGTPPPPSPGSSGNARRTNPAMWSCRARTAASASPSRASRRISRCSSASRRHEGWALQATVDTSAPGRALVEHPGQQRIAAGQVEGAVELPVGEGAFRLVGGGVRVASASPRGVQEARRAMVAAQRLRFHGAAARRTPRGPWRRRRCARSAPLYWLMTRRARSRRGSSTLPYGCLGHRVVRGQFGLHQRSAGRELPGEDGVLDRLQHVLGAEEERGWGRQRPYGRLSYLAYRVSYMTYEVRRRRT